MDKDTPDPADGRIERDADGGPQGTLHEGAANLVGNLVPELTLDERLTGLLRGPGATCTRAASPPGRTRSSATISAAPTRCRSTWPRPRAGS